MARRRNRQKRKPKSIEKILTDIYYDPSNSASFSSVRKLHEAACQVNPEITLSYVKKWLKGELTYTLHKPVIRKFKRNPVVVEYMDDQWQADLVELREFRKDNNGNNYILTVIDIFSKYAWVQPLKDKSGKSLVQAFTDIFKLRKPSKLQTDKGKEFINSDVQKLLHDNDVHYFTSKNSEIKCSVVERFNRTLKSKMFKYFTAKGTRRYIDVLQQFVTSYNNTVHSSIKMKPSEVNNETERVVFKNLYGFDTYRDYLMSKMKSPTHSEGDKVRLVYQQKSFDKGYYPNWSDEIYTINKVIKGKIQATDKLENHNGQVLDPSFYPHQLQPVIENAYRVESILDTRKIGQNTEFFVKWLNHPDSANSWISSKDLFSF